MTARRLRHRLFTPTVSRIEPDRYADTGFAVKDTAPEINAMVFAAIMHKTPEERLPMGLDMMATARELAWSSLSKSATEEERRRAFSAAFRARSFLFSIATESRLKP